MIFLILEPHTTRAEFLPAVCSLEASSQSEVRKKMDEVKVEANFKVDIASPLG